MINNSFKVLLPLLLLLFVTLTPQWATAQPIGQMIYFKTDFCPWCNVFEREVLGIFNRTDEGKSLPITEVTLRSENSKFPEIEKTIPYVPTFVILDNDGNERGRIFGYSRDFFWSKLGDIIKNIHNDIDSGASQVKEIDPRVALDRDHY
ncbi:MAG: hypothetical protein HQL71_00920 [Magnetococcales bacterium]|nr:hypothetical protein [Magnetococcales bacterium]